MEKESKFIIVVDRNYSPDRNISINATSKGALQKLAELFLEKGAKKIYQDIASIDSERDDFATNKVKKENINVGFFEKGEIEQEDPYVLLVVTSKDELVVTEDFLIKDYFGWGK